MIGMHTEKLEIKAQGRRKMINGRGPKNRCELKAQEANIATGTKHAFPIS